MPSVDALVAFAGVCGVIILLGSLALALQRLGIIGQKKPAPAGQPTQPEVKEALAEAQRAQGQLAGRISDLETERTNVQGLRRRLDAIEKEVKELRLHVAENYISREDWVPMTSRVIGMLEEHTAMLARLDERSRRQHGG